MNKASVLVTLSVVVLASAVLWPADDTPIRVTGNVFYRGEVVAGDVIDMSADAYCASEQSTNQTRDQAIFTGQNGGLRDVVVFVKTGVPSQPATPDDTPPVLDQQGCVYQPRVLAMHVTQPLRIRNSDATLHNVHAYANINRGFNIGQPFQGVESQRQFTDQEIGIDVRCDIHAWMQGAIAVFNHLYFDVTGADGQFSLNLPPGEYEIEAWHPELGSSTQAVTVSGAEMPQIVLEFQGQ